MLGAVGQDDIRAEYERADIFCLPSFAEGLPVVLLEAMAMELPVVATHVMAVPELVEHGVSGLLVAPARPDLLADALELLIDAPDERASMGATGRAKVLADHDAARSGCALRNVYRELGVAEGVAQLAQLGRDGALAGGDHLGHLPVEHLDRRARHGQYRRTAQDVPQGPGELGVGDGIRGGEVERPGGPIVVEAM